MRIPGRFLLTSLVVLLSGVLPAMLPGGFAAWVTARPDNRFLILEFIAIAVPVCAAMAMAACRVWLRLEIHSHPARSQNSTRPFFTSICLAIQSSLPHLVKGTL